MTSTTEIAEQYASCPRCAAQPGERCQTKSGGRATWTHAPRRLAVDYAYGEGYGDAEEWATISAARLLERLADEAYERGDIGKPNGGIEAWVWLRAKASALRGAP